MVKAIDSSMSQVGFATSEEARNKVIKFLKSSSDAVAIGMVQESTASFLQKEELAIKN